MSVNPSVGTASPTPRIGKRVENYRQESKGKIMLSGVYRFPAMESVIFGKRFDEALAQEINRIDARAVFILASGTLSRTTDTVDRLRHMLGNRCADVCAKIGPHTPRIDVVAAANAARETGTDLIVTLGGGSVTDAAKMVGLCLGNGLTEPLQLDNYRARIAADGTIRRPEVGAPSIRSIAIPTTLSAGEYTASAGCTDTARHVKDPRSGGQRAHPGMAVSVDRYPCRRPCRRGHLLGRRPADRRRRLLSRAAPARQRPARGQGGSG